jgi:hypothetical protein
MTSRIAQNAKPWLTAPSGLRQQDLVPAALDDAIFHLFMHHPCLKPWSSGRTDHLARFVMKKRWRQVALHRGMVQFHNIWVETRCVEGADLGEIKSEPYDPSIYGTSKPDRGLFKEDFFKDTVPLTCFKVTDLWQAARIALAVAGDGASA